MSREQRRLAAIVAADVVGYSRLMGHDESGTLARLREHRKHRFEPTLKRHGGRLVKLTGDGALAEFASAVDALSAVIEFQQAMAEANRDQPQDMAIVFRIGLHSGDVIVDGDDLYGDGVNVAARLEAKAPAGGILISRTIHEAVAGRLKATFDDLGGLSLKNIERPVHAFSVKWEPSDWQSPSLSAVTPSIGTPSPAETRLALPDKPSIAVLPFQNMSGDAEQEYFADGMVEDIITALSRFKSLFVIARNSSFSYKGKSPDVRQVGRELGVRYILEGSVRKSANRVRITGQLVDALSGAHLWADRFDGTLGDVFALQDRITTSVVGLIAPKIEQAEIERAKQKPTELLDSYDFYLRGTALYYQRQYEPAREFFKRAFERDPGFAAAYAMAAYTFGTQRGRGGQRLTDDMRDEALRLADIGARLAVEDAFVLAACGHTLVYFGHEVERGTSLVEQAVELNPNLATAWNSRGWVSLICGQADRSIESFQTLLRLSPLDPLKVPAWSGIAWALWAQGRYEEGRALAMKGMHEVTNVQSICAYIVNSIGTRHVTEARAAVPELLKLDLGFCITYALDVLPFRPPEIREKVASSFREAGLPE